MTVLLFNFSSIYEDFKCNIQSFLFFRPPGKASSNDQRLNVPPSFVSHQIGNNLTLELFQSQQFQMPILEVVEEREVQMNLFIDIFVKVRLDSLRSK